MGGTYPRTENDDFDIKLAKHAKKSERRRKAMEKSLLENMKMHAEHAEYLCNSLGGEILKINAKFAKEAAGEYSGQAHEEITYESPDTDMSHIDDIEISVYQPKPGDMTKTPEEISYEVLAKLEVLDENNNLPNYKEFSSMPEYANLNPEEKKQAYLEYRQGLISKMKTEREEGYDLLGFEADPTGRPLTKAEKIQEYRNINQVIEKGFSHKSLEELASHNVDTTQMIDPEREGITVSKEGDIKMFLFKAKDGGIAGLVETEEGTYVTPSRYEDVERGEGRGFDNNGGGLGKVVDEMKAWTVMLEQEGVHCEFLNRYHQQYADGVNSDFKEKGITHLFNTGDDKSTVIAGKIETMLHDSFNENKVIHDTFKNNEVSYYWEKIDNKESDFCSQIVDHINQRSSDVTGFKATLTGEKTIRIDIIKEGFENSFNITFKQSNLKGE